jgi:hypothetical protein
VRQKRQVDATNEAFAREHGQSKPARP